MVEIRYDEKGLVPAIVQDWNTGAVLMQAYMNEESLQKTIADGKATFFSRSKNRLWQKGEESGNFMAVKEILVDCDGDCILVKAIPAGPACHTNKPTCFFRNLEGEEVDNTTATTILYKVYDTICDRVENPVEGSYTNYLFEKGIDKMLKKVGEEASEVIIGAKNRDKENVQYEVADLIYHTWVVLREIGLEPNDIFRELEGRHK